MLRKMHINDLNVNVNAVVLLFALQEGKEGQTCILQRSLQLKSMCINAAPHNSCQSPEHWTLWSDVKLQSYRQYRTKCCIVTLKFRQCQLWPWFPMTFWGTHNYYGKTYNYVGEAFLYVSVTAYQCVVSF